MQKSDKQTGMLPAASPGNSHGRAAALPAISDSSPAFIWHCQRQVLVPTKCRKLSSFVPEADDLLENLHNKTRPGTG